jgi:FAD:protein FMN transferase
MITVTRRRCIAISAAAAGLELLPFASHARPHTELVQWHGIALGAIATLQIHHPDRATAQHLIARSLAEVRRLEAQFSLFREDSALVRLNRQGALAAPAAELVELLLECRRYSEITNGAFDATVQPLWNLYAGYFSRADADPNGPATDAIADSLARVGYRDVLISRDRIALARGGMQVTLNGIAQGYVTDRIVALLRGAGITRTLVDMGEPRCVGTHPDGRAWQVGIADPDRPDRVAETISIIDQAVATSGGYGFRFDPAGRFHHLFDPTTGRSAERYRSLTCIMPTATAADAFSTAFSTMTAEAIKAALKAAGGGQVHIVSDDGRRQLIAI